MLDKPTTDIVNINEKNGTPIQKFTEKGIVTDGKEREFDIIVLATGFDVVTGGMTSSKHILPVNPVMQGTDCTIPQWVSRASTAPIFKTSGRPRPIPSSEQQYLDTRTCSTCTVPTAPHSCRMDQAVWRSRSAGSGMLSPRPIGRA